MDKFTKYALITMTIILVIMLASTYVGVTFFKGQMKGTDGTATQGEATGFSYLHLTIEEEYVVFTIGGAAGGLFLGYLLPSVFGQNAKIKEGKQDV